jgi:hypothetical protein
MKIARQINLPREDSIFENGEPDGRYDIRQLSKVENDFVFTPGEYEDITSMENWIKYQNELTTDYLQLRDYIRDILNEKSWVNLTNFEKDIVIEYHIKEAIKTLAEEQTEKVTYLVLEKDISASEATSFMIRSFANHQIKNKAACAKRMDQAELYFIVGKYLDLSEATDFYSVAEILFSKYKDQGIKGTMHGDYEAGLFDFMESTVGTVYETAGLASQNYTMLVGTLQDFIDEMLNILRKGNY